MPRRIARHAITIDLKRDGADLVRTYCVPVYGAIASHRAPFDAIGSAYQAGDERGLAAIHGVLARGDRAELEDRLAGGDLDRAGAALFEALFGAEAQWGPVLRSAFQQPEPKPQPDPCRDALRVRIQTRDPILQGLPWRAAMWSGRLLIDDGWTFEVCVDRDPTERVSLKAPGSILVIAPDFPGMPPIGTEAHVRALADLVESLGPVDPASPRMVVARSLSEVERALRGMRPDMVYFYGHGDIEDDQLRLLLGDRRAEPTLMRDFARLLRELPPRVVFLNGCQTGQAGWHSAGAQLLPEVPVVIANATTAWVESAGRFAVQWLGHWQREGLDPVAALHQLNHGATTDGFAWITPVVHTHYVEFTTQKAPLGSSRLAYVPADWLDREEQRARVFGYISELARSPTRRVMAAVAYSAPGNHLDRLPAQILMRVESEAGERLHMKHIPLRFPEPRSLEELGVNLEHSLKILLRQDPSAGIEHVLRACAPSLRGGATPMVWLDWGVFGKAPRRQPFLSGKELRSWLGFIRDRIAPACPDEMRVVATVGLEADEGLLSELRQKIPPLESDPQFRNARFRFREIPPLKDVVASEILDYLEHAGCPEGIAYELADLVFKARGGRYEDTVELLQRGQASWYALRDELRGGEPKGSSADW
jgi:hypothetical protein